MKPVLGMLFGLALVLSIGACSPAGHERGFKSSETELMQELKRALEGAGVPFREDPDGFIRYPDEYQGSFLKIRAAVEAEIMGGVAMRVDDRRLRDIMVELLSELGLKHRFETRKDGEWIRWYPESLQQQAAMDLKLAERMANLQQGKSQKKCPDKKAAPAVSSPATAQSQ